jgi:hypothetical protein
LLSFAYVYFFGLRLFNGLQAIQIKNSLSLDPSSKTSRASEIVETPFFPFPPMRVGHPIRPGGIYITAFGFCQVKIRPVVGGQPQSRPNWDAVELT